MNRKKQKKNHSVQNNLSLINSKNQKKLQEILLIDDDAEFADLYKNKLEKVGYKVQIATGGIDVLNKINQYKPSLILLDIFLPSLVGIEMLKYFQNNQSATSPKVIMLTNNYNKQFFDQCIKAGASAFISKPQTTPNKLIKQIERIII